MIPPKAADVQGTVEPARAWTATPWLLVVLLLAVAFARWTATTPWAFLGFLLAAAAMFYLPGRLCLDLSGLSLDVFGRTGVSTLLGMLASASIYWLATFLGTQSIVWLWPVLASLLWLSIRRRSGAPRSSAGVDTHVVASGLVLLAIVPLAFLPLFYPNLSRLPQGETSFYALPDLILHLAVANELTHAVPPQVPFLPGLPLGYHYGMDLVTALLQTCGLDGADLTVRFMPTLFMTVTVLTVFSFNRMWLGSTGGAALTTLLVIFGEDFSFVPGLAYGAPIPWCIYFFGTPTVVSLYLLNPMLPALALLFGGLHAVTLFCREGRRGGLVVAAVLFAALTEFKVFCAVQVLLALAIAGVLRLWRSGGTRTLQACAAVSAGTLPLLLLNWFGASRAVVRLQPWPYVPAMMIRLGLWDTGLGHAVKNLTEGRLSISSVTAFFGVGVPLYLLGSFGLRSLAVSSIGKAVVRPDDGPRLILSTFILLGPLLTLTCTITAAGYPAAPQYNNAVWFLVAAKFVAWVFVAETLVAWWRDRGFGRRFGGVCLALALSLPSSLQFFAFQMKGETIPTLDADTVALLDFLEKRAPGEFVLAADETAQAIVGFTRCRSLVLSVFPHYFISRDELEQRARTVEALWKGLAAGELRQDLLATLGADLLVLDRVALPAASGVEGERVYENRRFVVLRLTSARASGTPDFPS